jgi:hypothetical protein
MALLAIAEYILLRYEELDAWPLASCGTTRRLLLPRPDFPKLARL